MSFDSGVGAYIQNRNITPSQSGSNYTEGVTAYGASIVSTEGTKPTFSATSLQLVPPASATDIFQITAVSKTVRVTRIEFSITGTAAAVPVLLYKRPTPSTGGTPATSTALPVPVAYDNLNAAATATTTAWTAVPTVTTTGQLLIRSANYICAAATAQGPGMLVWEFGNRNSQGLVLPAGFAACINLNTTTVTSPVCTISCEWTEE
jgi:hypothetical protein